MYECRRKRSFVESEISRREMTKILDDELLVNDYLITIKNLCIKMMDRKKTK